MIRGFLSGPFGFGEIAKYLVMITGFFLMGAGLVAILNAGLGMPPWDVFHLGLLPYLNISFGQTIQLVGFAAILVSWLLGVKPGLGAFLNMFFIGVFVDFFDKVVFIPHPEHLALKLLQFFAGVFSFAFGTVAYMRKKRGTGPRDSLMLAFGRITGIRLSVVRCIMEIIVTAAGYLMGGPLGAGTVLFAISIGPFMELSQKLIVYVKKADSPIV